MRKRDRIVMSQKELMRWHILTQILEKKITRARGAEEMGVTGRQIRRLLKRVGEEGAEGVCHCGRGRVSNRQLGEEIKGRALQLYQEKYWDFGPTLATEKLWERDQIRLGQGTLRLWLKEGEMDYPTRSARRHRRWRMRKRGRGEMVQMDGSSSYTERNNLTMRMSMRRFTRLTNAFSKKVENLEHAVALHFMYYNFARIHKTLRMPPAMKAGVTDHVWTIKEILNLLNSN